MEPMSGMNDGGLDDRVARLAARLARNGSRARLQAEAKARLEETYKALSRRLSRDICPADCAKMGRRKLAEIVEATVNGYSVRHAAHPSPIERRTLVTRLIKTLLLRVDAGPRERRRATGDEPRRTSAQSTSTRTKEAQVAVLLKKTVENGATRGEETSAVQLAHMLVRQHGLDIDAFKIALAKVGDPPRYAINIDGFLIPTETVRAADGARASLRAAGPTADETDMPELAWATGRCLASPTGRHRFERYARGTLVFENVYCLHCGIRE
jgi:hypothetical protein